jgi:hypothetical protein
MIYFIFHKIKICFRCHVHYTPFTCGKGLLKFYNFVQYIFNLKKIPISQLSNCECFSNVNNQLTSSQFFSHQNYLIKIVFNLVFYKIDYF